MEHSANREEDNADEMKSVDFRPDRKDPIPNLGSDPDPQAASTAPPNPRHGEGDNAAGTNANGMDLKEKKKNDLSLGGTLKPKKSVRWCEDLVTEKEIPRYDDQDYDHDHDHDRGSSNLYVNYSPAPPADSSSFNFKETMGTVKDVLGKWGRKVGEATKKAEDFAESTWQHLKTNPSMTEAALGRIAQGTKVLAEGGYEKIFRQTFETVPEEQLKNEFACYLSTSAGPVMGVLYVSTAKLAFCSDNPLSYHVNDKTDWSYYKVVIPLHQLQAVNPSASRNNPAEKYIQVISIDNHEFWFMGFLNYNGAAESLRQALSV